MHTLSMITRATEVAMRRRTQLTMLGLACRLRSGFGIGSDRLYDWNLEAGVTFVWR
jgi:hypothetical protein